MKLDPRARCLMLAALISASLSGCTTKAFKGELPEGQKSAIVSFSGGPDLRMQAMRIDGVFAGVVLSRIEVAPGAHRYQVDYDGEKWECETERDPCTVIRYGGVCRGELTAESDGRYRVELAVDGAEHVTSRVIRLDTVGGDSTGEPVKCEARRRNVVFRDRTIVPGFD